VNTARPLTPDEKGIREYILSIERSSRLKVTHLIANTNLSDETKVEDVLKGDAVVHRLAKELGLVHQ
jgi:transposase-like protein